MFSLNGEGEVLKAKNNFSTTRYIVDETFVQNRQLSKQGVGGSLLDKPYKIQNKWYYPDQGGDFSKIGLASWYGASFHGKLTADGEIFDMHRLTAAHPTMPLPSYARVTNLRNGFSLVVRVNDRGPFAKNRIIDLSYQAAELLGYRNNGLTDVKVEYIGRVPIHE